MNHITDEDYILRIQIYAIVQYVLDTVSPTHDEGYAGLGIQVRHRIHEVFPGSFVELFEEHSETYGNDKEEDFVDVVYRYYLVDKPGHLVKPHMRVKTKEARRLRRNIGTSYKLQKEYSEAVFKALKEYINV